MLSLMSWDDLKFVLAVYRAGSLLGAAKSLQVNASTVGRRIEALEKRLDLRIFDRTHQGIMMTAVAERILPFAESAEQAVSGFLLAVDGLEREVEGLVRISSPPGVASFLLAPWSVEWLRKYPKLQIEIDAEVGYVDLSRREADLALRSFRPESGDLISVKLIEGFSCVMASPEYIEKCGVVSDLAQIDWISWGPKLFHLPDSQWLIKQNLESNIVLRSDSYDVQVGACRAGLGALLLAEPLGLVAGLERVSFSAKLEKQFPSFEKGALWLVCHRALRHVPRIAAIWEALLKKARALSA